MGDDFGFGIGTGVFAMIVIVAVLGAVWIVPGWENRISNAKSQACEALGANLEGVQDKGTLGQCVKGNTIVLRFKD